MIDVWLIIKVVMAFIVGLIFGFIVFKKKKEEPIKKVKEEVKEEDVIEFDEEDRED